MVQDHNKHIYTVLSRIFNFHICKLGRPLSKIIISSITFFAMNSKVTGIYTHIVMVQHHNKHIYWVLSWIFNFHIHMQIRASYMQIRASLWWQTCAPSMRSDLAASVGRASFPLSLPEETDEPWALASEGYSPSAFLVGVSSHLQCVPRYHQNCSHWPWPAENSPVVQRIPYECPHGFHLSTPVNRVKPPIADPTSVYGPDPFISVPIHPRKDMIMCIAPGLRITSLNLSGSHHFTCCPTMKSCMPMHRLAQVIPSSPSEVSMYSREVSTVSGWDGGASMRGPNR